MSYDEWLKRADDYAMTTYSIDALEVVGDQDRLKTSYKAGEQPETIVEYYAEKYGLDKFSPCGENL